MEGGENTDGSFQSDITVVIAVYNGGAFLERAIRSINSQSLMPLEIIAVDDGSTDDSVLILSGLAKSSGIPIRIVRLNRNSGGPVIPMTTGVRLSKTPYVALLDQDDEMHRDRLSLQRRSLESCKSAIASIGYLDKVNESGDLIDSGFLEDIKRQYPFFWGVEISPDTCILQRDKARNYAFRSGSLTIASSTMLRKDSWEHINGFDPQFRIAWDLDFTLRALDVFDIVFVKKTIGFYRIHGRNSSGNKYSCLKELLRCRSKLLKTPGVGISRKELFDQLMDDHRSVAYHGILNSDRSSSIKSATHLVLLNPSFNIITLWLKTFCKVVIKR